MRFGTVCSGIEAASVAWAPLGWSAQFFSEIDPQASALLRYHYPDVPNHGDLNGFQSWPDHAIDLLAGGTPCQSFSVAGLRAGLADPRGNLTLTYVGVVARYRPRWIVWENVPGVLSIDGGRAFGALLGGLGQLGYGLAYRVLDAQFCRALGLPYAVPQRRRRVFVVGYLGDWRRAAAVLFDGASLRGDSPPRREAGKGVAPTLAARTKGGGGLGTDFDLDGGLTAVSKTLSAARGRAAANADDLETYVPVAHALRAEGFDASEDGTGRGTPLVPIMSHDPAVTLTARERKGPLQEADLSTVVAYRTAGDGAVYEEGRAVAPLTTATDPNANIIAFDTTQITHPENRSNPQPGDPSHPIPAHGHAPAVAIQAGALRENPASGPDGVGVRDDGAAYTIEARAEVQAVANGWAVRRLTPTECERLQGFPDGYTINPQANRPTADGPRYKQLGNSWATNVAQVIGERIDMVDAIP